MLTFVVVLQLLVALILIGVILFQSGKSQGLSGTIGGIADSYMSKSKAKSMDAKLARATKWVGAAFVVLTLVLNCMIAAGMYCMHKRDRESFCSPGFFMPGGKCAPAPAPRPGRRQAPPGYKSALPGPAGHRRSAGRRPRWWGRGRGAARWPRR